MQIDRSFTLFERYAYDRQCTSANGWAQITTAQDAPWFGNWINPAARQWLSFAEGDLTRVTCATDDEFAEYVGKTLTWYDEQDGRPAKIDCRLDTPAFRSIYSAFDRLGFSDRCR